MMRRFLLSAGMFAAAAVYCAAGPYEDAQARFKAGQYAEALASADAILKTRPTDFYLNENLRFLRLQCLWQMKADLPAIELTANEFVKNYPASVNRLEAAYYAAAAPSLMVENWTAARSSLAKFVSACGTQDSPWKDAAQAELAKAMVGCGDFEQAKEFVTKTLSARPDHPRRFELRFEAAMADYKNENFAAASERLQQLAADNKQSTSTLAQNARLYSGLAKYKEALSAQDSAADPSALFADAVARLDDAIALAPAVADEARYTRAMILKRMGDAAGYEAAAKEIPVQIAYNEALAFKTRSDWQGLKIALMYFLAHEGAKPSKWQDAAELDLAEAMNKLSEYAAVRQHVAKTLAGRPDHPRRIGLMTEAAVAIYKSQKWTTAIQEFDAVSAAAADDDYYDAFASYLGGVARLGEANRLMQVYGYSPQVPALRAQSKATLAGALKNGKLPIKFRVDVLYNMGEHDRMKAAAEEYLGLPEKATTPLTRTSMMDWLGVEYSFRGDLKTSRMWLDKVIEEYKRHPQEAAGIPATHSVMWNLWVRNTTGDNRKLDLLNALMLMPDDEFRSPILWDNRQYLRDLTLPAPKSR